MDRKLILVTGATGYIAGRLVPLLLEKGCRVRCLARDPGQLRGRRWSGQVETLRGDLVSGEGLEAALEGVAAACYLVHSMAFGRQYPPRDLAAARNFAAAAARAGIGRIVYLGGLADPAERIGEHMRSRLLTGEALREGPVPVTELRAGVIVGPGSISFEMIRYLTELFPVIVGPKWLENRVQPVAARDVLAYLLAALEIPGGGSGIYEIGGPDVMTFAETMRLYAQARGLKRYVLVVPGLPLGLMAFAVGALTPVPASIAAPLIDGMRTSSVVRDPAARRAFPGIAPQGYAEAVREALERLSPGTVEPVFDKPGNRITIIKREGFLIDRRSLRLKVRPQAAAQTFMQLGGQGGWLYLDWLWRLRGRLDGWLGGPGMRGARRQDALGVGDEIDFYRVEALEPGRMLRLRAELKAPGEGWMEWSVAAQPDEGTLLTQTAYFAPHGLPGSLYWYGLNPIHRLVFRGLLRRLAQRAVELQEDL